MKFAIAGLGYIAERHLEAIKNFGGGSVVTKNVESRKTVYGNPAREK